MSVEHLCVLIEELWNIRAKWFNFGLQLKMKESDLEAIRQEHRDNPSDCFRKLLSDWLKRVSPKPTWVAIISALKSDSVGNEQLAECLNCKYATDESLSGASMVAHNSELHKKDSNCDKPNKHFQCPCGECDLYSYLDNGCPKSTSETYPYLELSKLSDDEKKDLVQKLSQDTENILESFADLMTDTSRSLKKRNVGVRDLVSVSLNIGAYKSDKVQIPLLADDEQQLLKADSIDDVFIIIRRHISFFNYEILSYIIRKLGSSTDQENLKLYYEKFQTFCKRKVFEVSPTVFASSAGDDNKAKLFVILVTEDIVEKLYDIKASQRRIASLIGVKSSTLRLHRIDKASIILVFSIPLFVAQQLFPIDISTHEQLLSEGFTLLLPKQQLDGTTMQIKVSVDKHMNFSECMLSS